MGHFFFHFLSESERQEDRFGVSLPSTEAAYLQAVETAYGMAGELLAAGIDAARCAFEIANAEGDVLFRVDFAELLDRRRGAPLHDRPADHAAGLLVDTHRRAMAARSELASSLAEVRATLDTSYDLLTRLRGMEIGFEQGCAAMRPAVTGNVR